MSKYTCVCKQYRDEPPTIHGRPIIAILQREQADDCCNSLVGASIRLHVSHSPGSLTRPLRHSYKHPLPPDQLQPRPSLLNSMPWQSLLQVCSQPDQSLCTPADQHTQLHGHGTGLPPKSIRTFAQSKPIPVSLSTQSLQLRSSDRFSRLLKHTNQRRRLLADPLRAHILSRDVLLCWESHR